MSATLAPAIEASDLLDLAVRAARSAAEISRPGSHARAVGTKSSSTDPVSDADRRAEAAASRLIALERPDHGLLGEEGSERPSRCGMRWVIDALDGTVNYLYGFPHWAVSVACEQRVQGTWQAIVGVVHDVLREETFTALRGGPALLDGSAISVRDPVELSEALIATEFSYLARSRARQASALGKLLPRVRDIRSTGSSALDLCWVAAGRCDAFYEDELSRWDWAAGALIVQCAGGAVDALGSGVVAAGPTLHAELCARLERT